MELLCGSGLQNKIKVMRNSILLLPCIFMLVGCSIFRTNKDTNSEKVILFTVSPQKRNLVTELQKDVNEFEVLELNLNALNKILQESPTELNLTIPDTKKNQILELETSQVQIFETDFKVFLASTRSSTSFKNGLHYHGTIKGDTLSTVAISIFDNKVFGLISSKEGNQVLGKLKGTNWTNEYILYDDRPVFLQQKLNCQTKDGEGGYKPDMLKSISSKEFIRNCIGIYLEIDFDIFSNEGGVNEAVNYIISLFNQVKMLYGNENINIVLSEIFVWDIPSPYSGSTGQMMLDSYKANTGNFNGDLAQLLSYNKGTGGVAEFAGLCKTNPDLKKSFSRISSTFQNIPTYSWSVEVIAHEFGHLMGLKHTHACWWNGNNTAIDGCSAPEEGNCLRPGIPPEGGTIMSYCHLTSVGINFSLGFGAQPGNVMRNNVANVACCTCNEGEIGDVLAIEGKIILLRVHNVGTKYGPPSDQLDVEVIIWLDSKPYNSYGFRLRKGQNEKTHKMMLDQLRDAFNGNHLVRIEYNKTGCRVGEIFRVIELI